MGLADADSAEHGVPSENLLIAPVACPVPNSLAGAPRLVGKGEVELLPGTIAFGIYRRRRVEEEYFCNYEVNPAYESRLVAARLRISARGPTGEVRMIELPAHRFFLASLFQPQLSSSPEKPHPLIVRFFKVAAEFAAGAHRGLAEQAEWAAN
jgi:CTP synthase (UTP-ammonia lyase)